MARPRNPAELLRCLLDALGPVVCHQTPAENVADILERGLVPGRASNFGPGLVRPGAVYLCSLAASADPGDQAWGDAVLHVDLGALDPARLCADEENWRGTAEVFERRVGYDAASLLGAYPHMDRPEEILESFVGCGTAAYLGPIPPGALRLDSVAHRGDLPAVMELASRAGAAILGP